MHVDRTPPGRGGRLKLIAGAAVVLVAAVVALVLLRGDGSRPVEELELVDLPAHEMVQQVALALGLPYVVELPPLWPTETHDLRLHDTTLLRVLAEIRSLDPKYSAELRGDVVVYWAGPELVPESPYSRRLEGFRAQGGVAPVVRELVVQAGLERSLSIQADARGQARPVAVDMKDCAVRDVLVEIARQADLAMRNDPRMIRLGALHD